MPVEVTDLVLKLSSVRRNDEVEEKQGGFARMLKSSMRKDSFLWQEQFKKIKEEHANK